MNTDKYRVHNVSKGGSGGLGKFEAMLDQETRQLLDEFVDWLKTENICPSANSRASYRTYVAQGLAEPNVPLEGPKFSNHRSAWRRWEQFLDTLEDSGDDE